MRIISNKSNTFFVIFGLLSAGPTQAADSPNIPNAPMTDLLATIHLPANIAIYNIYLREFSGTTSDNGKGVFMTCDSSEIAMGGFCQEVQNGGDTPNALLSSGVGTLRTVMCKWKNPGQYRVVATCASVKAIVGDQTQGIYDPDHPENIK